MLLDVKLGRRRRTRSAARHQEALAGNRSHRPDRRAQGRRRGGLLGGRGHQAGRFQLYPPVSEQFDGQKLLADVANALERRQQTEETSMLRRALETMSGTASPIFQSAAMREVVRTIERIAPSDVDVLITGESGTGKEVIADLHPRLQPAQQGPNHQDQLRRPAARTDRKRTVRLGERRLHRRAHRPRGAVPPGRRRHAVAGRDLRDADGHPKQAAARAAGPGSAPGGRQDQPTRPTAAWSPRPIARRTRPFRWASCARICSIASAPFRSTCRRCASGAKTSCRWPMRS